MNSDCSGIVGGGAGDPQCGDFYAYEYPSGNSGGNNFDLNFPGPNPDELVFSTTAGDLDNDGATDGITVTLGGVTEFNYDWVYITDGAGDLIYGPLSGGQSGSYSSTDGTINVYLAADNTFELGPVTFTIACNGLSINDNEIAKGKTFVKFDNSICGISKEGSPSGTTPTIATPEFSPKKFIHKLAIITAMRAPGIEGLTFFKKTNIKIDANPIIIVSEWIWELFWKNSIINKWILFLVSNGAPNRCLSWLNPIIIAAAEVNPDITGFERKLTKNPILKNPSIICIEPIKKAKNIAMDIYSSIPERFKAANPEATRRESIATGPTANFLDVPIKA